MGKPVQARVALGASSFAADEFEGLVQRLRENRKLPVDPVGSRSSGVEVGRYATKPWAKLEGRGVKRPPGFPEHAIDWAGTQTAALVQGKSLFVNDRIEQVAFDLDNGRQRWIQSSAVRNERQGWPLVAMPPVVVGGRMFVRRLTNDGPELVCFEASNGKLVWHVRPDGFVGSEPLFVGPKLFVLTVASNGVDKLSLYLVGLSTGSGRLRSRTLLAEFRDAWHGEMPCQAVAVENRIFATAGGAVLACDSSGRVEWIRRQIWIPTPAQDYTGDFPQRWLDRTPEAPLVASGKVYATQPGVWGIECLEMETGRLVWRRDMGDLARLVGRTSGQLIVQGRDALLALSLESGETLWQRPVAACLDAKVSNGQAILCARAGPKKEASSPVPVILEWFDVSTGRVLGSTAIDTPPHADPRFRPLVTSAGRQWGFFATSPDQTDRQILELKRLGELRELTSE